MKRLLFACLLLHTGAAISNAQLPEGPIAGGSVATFPPGTPPANLSYSTTNWQPITPPAPAGPAAMAGAIPLAPSAYAVPATFQTPAGPVPQATGAAATAEPVELPAVWINADYLMWWFQGMPLPAPILTSSSNVGAANAGAIGATGTSVLLGGQTIQYGLFNGLRVTTGAWIDNENILGLEASGMFFPKMGKTSSVTSNTGNVVFYSPATEVGIPQGPIASAFPWTGSSYVTTATLESTELFWGADANLVCNLVRSSDGRRYLNLLSGFRYLDLAEDLNYTTEADVSGAASSTTQDLFRTRNQFYGGQLGLKGEFGFGRFSIASSAKVALGATHEKSTIGGDWIVNTTGTPATYTGGIYAGSSNIGTQAQNRFGVVPDVQMSLGVAITERIRMSVGYNFLYWSNVLRAGNQVDTRVDFANTPPSAPLNLRSTSSFWAQGLNYNFEFRY